ncbi:Signal transduction histidine-protein kinase BarA [Chryseobacterium aquaeductus]|uniref:histidine kinase n=1 Tax=Chryseobacterium aquaeductus TaxID=2675056 RepID=A0A9N8MDU2_9FLAO|nr:HAMP domain-containing sensor histidine kinase [Chryseobacterium aquaeductus]CAA7330004.1 Signal transduction histidine-protein kinase BarA [Chryseobacterium potabilaquae]CAD7800600.1 Signal transduction histidine-protein kinase BarA [Chryseobacterium aquaeductus]
MSKKSLSFKLRKIVQYSLIICILLLQCIIGGFFYNEFVNNKNLNFIEKQLKEVHQLENLTDDSRKELDLAQNYFQRYVITEDNQYLNLYFNSVKKLSKNLDSINHYKYQNPRLKNILASHKKENIGTENLKLLVDSMYEFSTSSNSKMRDELPKLKKYNYQYNFDQFEIQTKKFSDTIKKKGLFGRLGDAISGKENLRKDSVVVTMKGGKILDIPTVKQDFDSIVNSINNHYTKEVQRIQIKVGKNKNEYKTRSSRFYSTFNSLLIYSNELMNIYEFAIRDSESELEKEYALQNSKSNKIRKDLMIGLMILMFFISILIMYFTRIAFIYERRLNSANKQINENLNFKNRILGMLSHELRSPLKIIGIFVNRINKKTTDESIKEYLKSISFTNNTLLMQANQILEYTKNQHVENKLIPVVFNLNQEIESILSSIEPYIQTRNNKFVINKKINPDLVVFSDNTKINQIFMNILGNANKFTENGEISVITFAQNLDESTVVLNTKISDTGAGISKSDLEKIFEPYYQGVLSNEVENLGAGLGLSLCKEIVELYGGSITVESESQKGTTVSFSINLNINK